MSFRFIAFYLFLFLLTFFGGLIPVIKKNWSGKYIDLLSTFSGAFLLGITFVHLIPDSIGQLGFYSGILMLLGFFVQQIVQQFTHGVEHGHHHNVASGHLAQAAFWPILIGLTVHAISEGLPLAINYPDANTLPSLVLAIGLHKIPEAMLVIALFLSVGYARKKAILLAFLFASLTPLTASVTRVLGSYFHVVNQLLTWCIPVVAGAFIQIATTIFYESGSKGHVLQWRKGIALLAGIGIALITLLF